MSQPSTRTRAFTDERWAAATRTLTGLVEGLVARGRSLVGWRAESTAKPGDLEALTIALLSRRGEASGVAIAAEILAVLDRATFEERAAYLDLLARRFGADADRLGAAVEAWRAAPSPETERALHEAAEPRRQEAIRRLNLAPGGTTRLVALRADLLEAMEANPALQAVDADFHHLFGSWFNRGFLVIRRIDWTTPANVLEKIIAYEAVHAIRDWNDLRNRLEPIDRRLYAFFHPRLADEPLVFVEVALTRATPDRIAPLLDLSRTPSAEPPTTAVFYSISTTQKGLRGVSFGNFLIKQVVEELRREFATLTTFVTLSPVPGFAAWLARERAEGGPTWLEPAERAALAVLDQPGYADDRAAVEALRGPLAAAAATYLTAARSRTGRAVDPVARFHLGNGARLERLNLFGDVSAKGLAESHGLMVNYLYDLPTIEQNHEAYAERGEIVAHGAVKKLARALTSPPAAAP